MRVKYRAYIEVYKLADKEAAEVQVDAVVAELNAHLEHMRREAIVTLASPAEVEEEGDDE